MAEVRHGLAEETLKLFKIGIWNTYTVRVQYKKDWRETVVLWGDANVCRS
jgi:hypothetical protein